MILAILQVRMTSPRLPGKAMAPLRGEPMVWRQVERVRMARSVGKVVVATSADPSDDPLASFLVARGQTVFRGASANLTERFMRCVEAAGPVSHVVRLKGDSPFVDPTLIDDVVQLARSGPFDYVSNRAPRTYPLGLEVEAATVEALTQAAKTASPSDALNLSPMSLLRNQPDRFAQGACRAGRDWSSLDWRVKTPADFAFARAVYDALHPADPAFGMVDILDILQGRQDLARWAA